MNVKLDTRKPRFVQTGADDWTDRLTGRVRKGQVPSLLRGFYLPQRKEPS